MPRSRNSSVTSDDEDVTCFGAICYLIGCLLCLTKMKPKTRIFLTWFWLFIFAVTSGVIVSSYVFTSYSVTLHPKDMRLFKCSTWCSSMEIRADKKVDVFLYPSSTKPEILIDTSSTIKHSFVSVNTLDANEFVMVQFYLLTGSTVVSYSCIEGMKEGSVYVFQGKSNFSKWETHPSCTDCYVQHVSPNRCHITHSVSVLTIKETEDYYFVSYNTNPEYDQPPIKFMTDFQIKRSVYDIGNAQERCPDSESCSVRLDVGGQSDMVIRSKDSYLPDPTANTTISAHCQPRWALFVPVFVFLPLGIGVAIHAYIICKARRSVSHCRRSNRDINDIFTIADHPNSGVTGITSPVFAMDPPPYTECYEGPPPSYEEVIRLKELQSESSQSSS